MKLELGKTDGYPPFAGGVGQIYRRYVREADPHFSTWVLTEKPALSQVLQKVSKDSRVLEVGSGAGQVLNLLFELGFRQGLVTSLEPNSFMSGEIEKEFPDIAVLKQNIIDLYSYGGSLFNVIIAHMVLNHIPTADLLDNLQVIRKVLKDGGTFLIMLPNPRSQAIEMGINEDESNVVRIEPAPWGGFVEYHHRSEKEFTQMLYAAGFSSVNVLYRPMYTAPLNTHEYSRNARLYSVYMEKNKHALKDQLPRRILIEAIA